MENLTNNPSSSKDALDNKTSNSGKTFKLIYLVIAIVSISVLIIAVLFIFKIFSTSSTNPKVSSSDEKSGVDKTKQLKISVVEEGKLVLSGGYADPSIIKTKNDYRMYVNRQSGGPGGILIFSSKDGVTWVKETDIVISGASTGRAISIPTGGVRVYYPGTQPIRATDPISNMYSSFSSDGLSFKKDAGIVIAPRSSKYYIQGPTVFQLPDKTWRMYFHENTLAAGMQADGEIWGASSKDGVTWTRDDKVTLQMDTVESSTLNAPWKQVLHPFVLKNPKGGYIMFYNTHSEMFAATSEDGISWKKIGDIGIHGADMDGYFQEDGTIRAFYGDFDPKVGGLVYMAVLKLE